MVFSPQQQKLYCPYCDATQNIKRHPAKLRPYNPGEGEVTVDLDTYQCPNCSGMVKLSPFDSTKKCPFCGATNIVAIENLKGLKPDSILPFIISKEQAAEKGKEMIKSKLLAPTKLKKSLDIENFKGLYFPNFAFNSDASSQFEGRLGEREVVKRGTGKNAHLETRIKYFHVRGVRNDSFQDKLVEACTQLKQEELRSVLPYDMENVEGYSDEYVSGFAAERYDTSLDNSFNIAKGEMDATIRSRILSSYKHDVVDYLNVNTLYSNTKYRYSLLPIWICVYKYKDKIYRFIVNGRTGKSSGKVPKSPGKIAIIAVGAVLIIIGIILLYFLTNK